MAPLGLVALGPGELRNGSTGQNYFVAPLGIDPPVSLN
mgnify:FL=1